MTPSAYGDLAALFAPSSVAVLGASADPAKFGGRVLHYLTRGDFAGTAYAVNARADRVQGVRAYPTVETIGAPVDLAVIALPAAACIDAVADCGRAGVRAAIVLTSGFAEDGDAGRARQDALLAAARAHGVRLLGPNCIGLANGQARMAATFATMWLDGWPVPGPVSIVSQSGALASYFHVLLAERGMGVAHWCSTGNEIDVDAAECVEWLATDPATRVIVVALEGLRDGRRLAHALLAARAARKPVLLMKLGRSRVGTQAALSHTGALAGDDRVLDAVIRQCGALRCDDFTQAVDLAITCALARFPAGRRVGIVSASGGGGIMAADRAEERGLEVPELGASTRASLDAMLPGGTSRNPVDVTAMVLADYDLMVRPIGEVARDPGVDGVVVFLTSAFRSEAAGAALRERLVRLDVLASGKPVLLCGVASAAERRALLRDGFALFTEPRSAIDALAALADLHEHWDAPQPSLPPAAPLAAPAHDDDEATLLGFLERHGVPAAPTQLVRDAVAAESAAVAIGFPVVLKFAVRGLHHKSDVGGVVTDVASPAAVRAAFATLTARAERAGLGGRLAGIVVQAQAPDGVEILLGMRRDPAFGAVILVGMGGKWVELLADVAIRLAPVDAAQARSMLAELKGFPLLQGLRGEAPADVDALVAAIVAFSALAARLDDTATLEVNPFVVARGGSGGVAVDAKRTPAA